MASLPGSGVAWTVVAVKGFQSFYYVENRAPMSSSDVTGLLIGPPKARLFFFFCFTMHHSAGPEVERF